MTDKEIFSRVEQSHIFENLPKELLRANMENFKLQKFSEGEVVLKEGQKNNVIHIIHSGEAAVFKSAGTNEKSGASHRVASLSPGEEFGEMAALENSAASATVLASKPLELISIDLSNGNEDENLKALTDELQVNIGRRLARRLRETTENKVAVMERELQVRREQTVAGRFAITILTLVAIYTVMLRAILDLNVYSWMEVYYSPLIIVAFMFAIIYMMKKSDFSFEHFGVTTKNWWPAVQEAVLFSIPFCGAITLLKWAYVSWLPFAANMPVFTTADMFSGYYADGSFNWWIYVGFLFAYAALCPVQELIGRCGVQAPLFTFLQGSEKRRHFLSILVSNLMYSASHSHLNLSFAIATFVPGLFWGWLFMHNKSLIGVSVSHALIGAYALFALGLEEFLK